MKLHPDLKRRCCCPIYVNRTQASTTQLQPQPDPLTTMVVYRVRDHRLRELDDNEKHCDGMLKLLVSKTSIQVQL